MKRSKAYKEVSTKVEPNTEYALDNAITLMKDVTYTKFTSSADIIINFVVTAKHKNESIRGSVTLPHNSSEKTTNVIVIAEGDDAKAAEAAGADEVGSEDLIKKIGDGFFDFDVLIATPAMMPKLARLGKVLGPKGLMPNPKNETVTTNVEKVVKSYKAGKLDYRLDAQGAIKGKFGKVDQKETELKDNFMEFFKSVYNDTRRLGPNRLKSIYVAPTMGPSIKIDKNSILKEIA